MGFKKGLCALIFLAVAFCLGGCGKKKEAAAADAAATQSARPAIPTGEMVFVPAGEFIMGTNDTSSKGYPEHKVNLKAFLIDKFEVTNYEFLEFAIKNKYAGEGAKTGQDWRLLATPDKALVPVVYITWNDANAYCKAAGKRLPTEEEWEKAARGPNGFKYPWGNEWVAGRSNTAETGMQKQLEIAEYNDVSPYGAYDMLGNVQEWTGSWYSSYPGAKKDPNSGEKFKVVRGISYHYKGEVAKLYDRTAFAPSSLYDFGCRCAKDATLEDEAKYSKK
jgi:formylglycine-generating enzyme required for sulfatase activity